MATTYKETARGYQSSVTFIPESSYRNLPSDPVGYKVPVVSCSMDGGRNLVADNSMRGQFAPGKPGMGNMSAGGSITLKSGIHSSGIILKHFCGAPVTTAELSSPTISGSASKIKAGVVRIPCVGHGFRPFTQVTISGTTNYDGVYLIQPESDADSIAIESVYKEENFAGTETVKRGAYHKLDAAAAVDKGDGKVGLPCAGHGYNYGEKIAVTGSTGYDAEFVVLKDSTANEIVVTSAYAVEVFKGTEIVAPKFFKHRFKLTEKLPSFVLQEYVPVQSADHNDPYWLTEGCKISNLTCSSSASSEGAIEFSLNITGADVRNSPEAEVETPIEVAYVNFEHSDGELRLGGERQAKVAQSSMQIDVPLDTSNGYVEGSKGTLACLDESTPTPSGSLTCHYTDTELGEKAMAGVVMDYAKCFVSKGSQLTLLLPESQIEPRGHKPKLTGPGGIMIECQVQGFQENNAYESCFVAELVNGIAEY